MLLAFASGVLFALAFPPADLGVLGWVALVPLYFAVRDQRPARAAMLGAVFAAVSRVVTFAWIFRFDQFRLHHALFLGAWLGLPYVLIAVVLARFARDGRALFFVPAAATILEWSLAHAGFLAFPWATFAQTQTANLPLLQLASVGGEPLLTFVVASGNVALCMMIAHAPARRAAFGVLAAALACHVFGAFALASTLDGEAVGLAAVQPMISLRERTEAHANEIFERLARLTREAGAAHPALIVWPETAVRDPERDIYTKLRIRRLVEETETPILFGASEIEKLDGASVVLATAKIYNAAYLMKPGESVGAPYAKVRLLPFAEYQPLGVKWPAWLVPAMFLTEPGSARTVFALPSGLRVEPIICWENLFAGDVRATATAEPSVIAHLVNDAWFGPTSEPGLHNLVSVIRAVENRRPVVIASNSGPSEIIDSRGRVIARSGLFTPAMVTASVIVPSGLSLYRRAGDLSWAVPMLIVGGLLSRRSWGGGRRRRLRAPNPLDGDAPSGKR